LAAGILEALAQQPEAPSGSLAGVAELQMALDGSEELRE
jgi:hypothetical protein